MDSKVSNLLKSMRAVVEAASEREVPTADAAATELPKDPSADSAPASDTSRKCPKGFKFDGKHCVPIDKSKKADAAETDTDEPPDGSPPEPRKGEEEGDFPATRHFVQKDRDKDIPLVPDPEHEVMQQPHNAITYANGKRSFEHADTEYSEYAHNAFVQAKFPEAFGSKGDFVTEFLHGKHMFVEDWSTVQNCSAATQKQGDRDDLIKTLWNFKQKEWVPSDQSSDAASEEEFAKYVDGLIEKADKEDPELTPPVIIGVHKDATTGKETDYLISGNSRALVYAFLGKPAPVRAIPLRGRMLPDPTEAELQNYLWPAEKSSDDDDEAEKNIRLAIQQVMQAREAGQQESTRHILKKIFTEADGENGSRPFDGPPKRKYPSGHLKRMFRKAYDALGYPVGTVRKWAQGKMVKTASGWEPIAAGQPVTKAAAADVPAAKGDTPEQPKTAAKAPAKVPGFTAPTLDPSLSADDQHPSVYNRPSTVVADDDQWIDTIPGFPKQTTDRHYHDYKKPKQYRQRLHDTVLGRLFDKVPVHEKGIQPVAVMLMGGPASGKSTLGSAYPDDQFVHLDADALKEHIPEYRVAVKWRARNAARMAHEESIHLMQQLREKTIASGKNLVMDGSGRHLESYLRMIRDLHQAGYHVKLVMAHNDKDIALARAKARGRATGRWIPDHIFDDTYDSVPKNFKPIANAADDFEVWDTRQDHKASLVWEKTSGKEVVHDADFVKDFQKKHDGKHAPVPPPTPTRIELDPHPVNVKSIEDYDIRKQPDGTFKTFKKHYD